MAARVLGEWQRQGQPDLEAGELAVRASMHRLGGRLLEQLLGADGGGYQGARIDCGQGHEAQFNGLSAQAAVDVLGAVRVRRAYYHCADCGGGVVPKDGDLDLASTFFSPGVRRMMGRVGAKESRSKKVSEIWRNWLAWRSVPRRWNESPRASVTTSKASQNGNASRRSRRRSSPLRRTPGPDDVCGDRRDRRAGPACGGGRSGGERGRSRQEMGRRISTEV